ncbi:hypothetical protein [Actinophytocola sp.]|uniref:hypothetical protein n=1 Tax=Actinophytocola sp. TaxID=1872138 RepID=UPI00389A6B1B
MGEEELITQLGLLLTQTRFARRALEDIERATSTYATFTFTSVIAAGPKFGEPPLFDGALKVHVVNISDLAPGAGFGSFIEGLLGGAGRLVGNLVGGAVGGTVGTLSIIGALPTIHAIAEKVQHILELLSIDAAPPPARTDERGAPVGGSDLVTQLAAIRSAVDGLTGLFLAAGGKPEQAAATSNLPSTPQGASWLRMLDSATVTLSATARLVDGLIIALPLVIGSVSWLISRLGDLRLAVAEFLRFALRNALLLRGTVLVTAFDTLAMVARMGATVIGILQSTVDGIVSALFDTVREALLAVFDLGAVLGGAVKKTVDELLNWLVPTVDVVLRNLADLRVFRVITHVIRILPAILPPIFELATDKQMATERPVEFKMLQDAAKLPFLAPVTPAATGAGRPAIPPPMPDFRAILSDPALTGRATGPLDRMQQVVSDGLRILADDAKNGLRGVAGRLDAAAAEEARLSDTTLGRHLASVRAQSTALAENLVVGERVRPETGLEAIATAYEGWLTGGGLNTLLGKITEHFSSAEGRAGIPARIAESGMVRPRATVQIDEVVIDIEGPAREPVQQAPQPAPPQGPGDFPVPADRDDMERLARMWFDYDQRGGGSRLPFPI